MINRITLVGHLGANPTMSTTKNGNKVAEFSLPLYHVGEKDNDKRQWVDCNVWNRLAEIVFETQRKGHLVYIEGELNNVRWQTENKEWRNRATVTVNLIRFLTPKGSSATSSDTKSENDETPTQTYEEYQQDDSMIDIQKDLEEILS